MCVCVAGAMAVYKSQIQGEEEELQELRHRHSQPVQGEHVFSVFNLSFWIIFNSGVL